MFNKKSPSLDDWHLTGRRACRLAFHPPVSTLNANWPLPRPGEQATCGGRLHANWPLTRPFARFMRISPSPAPQPLPNHSAPTPSPRTPHLPSPARLKFRSTNLSIKKRDITKRQLSSKAPTASPLLPPSLELQLRHRHRGCQGLPECREPSARARHWPHRRERRKRWSRARSSSARTSSRPCVQCAAGLARRS